MYIYYGMALNMAKTDRNEEREERDSGDVPVTVNSIIKWTGIIFTVISGVVSLVWFAALIKGDIITLQQDSAAMKRELEARNVQQDKDIEKLKDRADETDKAMSELTRKLDIAVTLLQRIDAKVGKP